MPEFVLDMGSDSAAQSFSALDSFAQGYIMAAFFTECEHGTNRETWEPETQSSLPGDVTLADLAPESIAAMLADCAKFENESAGIRTAMELNGHDWDEAQAGRDFWYTRNGHGCGFWDGDWPEPYGDQLTKVAKTFREVWSCLGDDGRVYIQ